MFLQHCNGKYLNTPNAVRSKVGGAVDKVYPPTPTHLTPRPPETKTGLSLTCYALYRLRLWHVGNHIGIHIHEHMHEHHANTYLDLQVNTAPNCEREIGIYLHLRDSVIMCSFRVQFEFLECGKHREMSVNQWKHKPWRHVPSKLHEIVNKDPLSHMEVFCLQVNFSPISQTVMTESWFEADVLHFNRKRFTSCPCSLSMCMQWTEECITHLHLLRTHRAHAKACLDRHEGMYMPWNIKENISYANHKATVRK